MSVAFYRNLSPTLQAIFSAQAAIGSRCYNSEIATEITLSDDTKLYFATADLTIDTVSTAGASVAITPKAFSARFSGAPELRITSTKAPESAELQIINLDYVVSSVIPNINRMFDGAHVRLYLCFRKSDGNYEGVVMFDGFISEVAGDDEDARMNLVSDGSSVASKIGKEVTQRCVNVLGDSWCGVNLLPGGAVCSKIWNDNEAGCAYWGGVYNGVPFINPLALQENYPSFGYVNMGDGWVVVGSIP
jgi:hypothetical protein